MTAESAPRDKKAPRRTAQRILDTALDLFNRYGEPQVSTNRIAAELRMSPGNLHYHFAAKDDLLAVLFTEFSTGIGHLAAQVTTVTARADARLWFERVLGHIWEFRFLTRHMGDLVTRIRALESAVPTLLLTLEQAIDQLLIRLGWSTPEPERQVLRNGLCNILLGWFNLEFLRDPRHAMETDQAPDLIARALSEIEVLLTMTMPRGRPITASASAPDLR